jgi:hypothetical protein
MKDYINFITNEDFNAEAQIKTETGQLLDDELLDAYSQAIIGAAEKLTLEIVPQDSHKI